MMFRTANIQDLPNIKHTFGFIVKHMQDNHLNIWDDVYPSAFFEDDIRNNRLYVMLEEAQERAVETNFAETTSAPIVSAFALCDSDEGENTMTWKDCHANALYLDRLGVNVTYSRKGIGSLMLEKAKETAKALGAEYLRLFVVDENLPAIRLYEKNGFEKVEGVYYKPLDETDILREYGYEIKL